jgi:NTP pyrophosphatase (non-canonical NTP hydrolase)
MISKKGDELDKLTDVVLKFRDERDWRKFHTPKDLAMDLSVEAAELLEIFLWKDKKEIKKIIREKKKEISDELCDVLHVLLLLSHDLDIDLIGEFHRKMEDNRKKYPADKVRGKNKKYTEYR